MGERVLAWESAVAIDDSADKTINSYSVGKPPEPPSRIEGKPTFRCGLLGYEYWYFTRL